MIIFHLQSPFQDLHVILIQLNILFQLLQELHFFSMPDKIFISIVSIHFFLPHILFPGFHQVLCFIDILNFNIWRGFIPVKEVTLSWVYMLIGRIQVIEIAPWQTSIIKGFLIGTVITGIIQCWRFFYNFFKCSLVLKSRLRGCVELTVYRYSLIFDSLFLLFQSSLNHQVRLVLLRSDDNGILMKRWFLRGCKTWFLIVIRSYRIIKGVV